jgi:hypothetical protein
MTPDIYAFISVGMATGHLYLIFSSNADKFNL